jgi:pyruvate formate lyase activating enzyme
MITRREFCKLSCEFLTSITAAQYLTGPLLANQKNRPYIQTARYFRQLEENKVQCELCPRRCIVAPKQRGYCGVRENQNGDYQTLIYGRLTAINNDPIEKKPLFHFLPGTTALSVSTSGCNVKCKFCQNWNLSQSKPEELNFTYIAPEQLVKMAQQYHIPSIANTYNEPTIFTEYIIDTAAIGREQGIRSVSISNGFINREPLLDLCNVLDAIKIDFKAFSEHFYRDIVDGSLAPVLDTMVEIKSRGTWLEMVNLIIPTLNDDPAEIADMCKWITTNLGLDVPLHFTRFHPQYLLKNLPPTPVKTLETAYKIAKDAGIHYVYVGNVPGHSLENTVCPYCNTDLIVRRGYSIVKNRIKDGKCPECSAKIPGIWS